MIKIKFLLVYSEKKKDWILELSKIRDELICDWVYMGKYEEMKKETTYLLDANTFFL